jgi:uncharacterized protein (TIGR00255 family)
VRIVSLLPSATEIVAALGLAGELVGITHECDWPPEVAGTPVMTSSVHDLGERSGGQIHRLVQDAIHGGSSLYALDEAALEAARRCVAGLREAREREGQRLVTMLMDRVTRLRELAGRAEPLMPVVVQRQQQRFLERWNEALASANAGSSVPAAALQERALAEAASYAIRIDVAEELTRLHSHLDEIERLLTAGGELGKRLDFLIQELQREANTLGSKSPAIELTAISVEMKVLVEQMREQVQNIE